MEHKKSKFDTFYIIFLALLLIYVIASFSLLKDFGITWDEPVQQYIGKVNSDYIHGRTDKLEDLPEDLNYYGPFFETLNYDFSTSLMDSFRMLQVDAFHILIILSFSAGVFFFFKLVRLIYGSETALFASLFLFLNPILFAHSHYNSKDIPLVAGFTITLYLWVKFEISDQK